MKLSLKTIEDMVDWVEINLSQNPTLEDMSHFVGYSAFYCSAKFHEVVGISFKEYLLKRKLARAALELQVSKDRIIDIAVKYGFSSNEAFTRAFYRNFGYTPCQYRKQLPLIPLYEKPVLAGNSPG